MNFQLAARLAAAAAGCCFALLGGAFLPSTAPLQAAAISWDGGGADDQWSTVANWSDNAAADGDDITFNNTDTRSNSTTINNLVSASITVNSLVYANSDTGTAAWHNTQIDSGQTLSVGGTTNNVMTVGNQTAGANNNTRVTISGDGALAVARTGGVIQVGGYASGTSGSNAATLDMSGLATFSANLGTTGTFRIGDNKADGSPGSGGVSIVYLADTSTITTGTLTLGGDSGVFAGPQTLKLGSVQNTLNATTINVGAAGNSSARSVGNISFNEATGDLKIRSAADTVNGRANMTLIGNGTGGATSGTSGNLNGTVNLNGHSVDLRLGTLNIASRQGGTAAGAVSSNSLFAFDTGTVNVNTILLGQKLSGNSATGTFANNQLNVGGGTFTVNTSLILARNTSGSGAVEGILNLSGGTHTLAAVTLGDATVAGGSASGTINLTGGATTMTGNILRGSAVGTTTATVTLNGGSLNMAGFNLGGSGTTNLTTLNLQAGTLSNVGQINNGGAFAKTTAGTLILEGTNTYSGTLTISGGVLQVGSGGATGTLGSGGIVNNAALVFDRTAAYTVANAISGSGTVTVQGTTGVISFNTANSYAGGTTVAVNGAGGLSVGHANALGSGTLTLASNSSTNTTLRITGGINFANAITIDTTAGRNNLFSTAGANTLSGPITINGTGAGGFGVILGNTSGQAYTVSSNMTAPSFLAFLSFRNTAATASTMSGVINAPSATLDINSTGNWTFSGVGSSWTTTSIPNSGNLILGANNALATGARVNWGASNTGGLILNGFNQTVAGIDAASNTNANVKNNSTAANSTLTLAGLNANRVFAGTLSDGSTRSLALVMNSAGRSQTLTAANTYTGGTTITAGTLVVNNASGSATGSGAVAVGAAGNLAGAGFITGLVTSAAKTSQFSPGNSPGTLSLLGGLNASAGATFNFELGTVSDLIDLGSGVFTGSSAANGLVFNIFNSGGITSGVTYTLLTFGSSVNLDYADLFLGTRPSGVTLDGNFGNGGWLINSNSLQIQFAVVPEPSTLLLAALGALGLAWRFRPQRRLPA